MRLKPKDEFLQDAPRIALTSGRQCINETLFGTLGDARQALDEWQEDYNVSQTTFSTGSQIQMEFLQKRTVAKMLIPFRKSTGLPTT